MQLNQHPIKNDCEEYHEYKRLTALCEVEPPPYRRVVDDEGESAERQTMLTWMRQCRESLARDESPRH